MLSSQMDFIYLFFISFAAATILPLGSEGLLLYDISIGLNTYLILLFATIGNALGSIFNYWLGYKGEEYLENKKAIKKDMIIKIKVYFDKYGGYSLFLSWVPIIGDPITIVAGVLKYSLKKFILIVVIAKFTRYLFITLGYFYFN